ncbi:MAG: DUF4347 domain-containing protein, partial [Magnetococcales bacterium]|nr:DUF4347 domain-containing protein [Magnetococcales bacterium]
MSLLHSESDSLSSTVRLAFVDAGLTDAQRWAAAMPSGVQVIWIAPDEDGLACVTRTLQQFQSVAEIHLVGHGAAGAVRLGAVTLTSDTLDLHAASLALWGDALTENADLLLYGCDVAAGGSGERFLDRLAARIGADVAASSDPTGSTRSGGDWELEVASGPIEAATLFGPDNPVDSDQLLSILNGTAGNDTLTGTAENDTITGGGGTDVLQGSGGDDQFVYGYNTSDINGLAESVSGGTGSDSIQMDYYAFDFSQATLSSIETFTLSTDADVTLTPAQLNLITTLQGTAGYENYVTIASGGTTDFSGKSWISIERLYGSSGDDTVIGN